ncbi:MULTISPECIES: aldehyde dehydrogenase [Solibacillus]|uniref:Aldehyde dehydrogenase n=1 Tax=Solibacillus merdavium TaxID=2762218 RepID=A0ABR8XKD5_9BACL|nr:aldehyde dehydrogenase [Solibacillus merdavium]MBD8032383.1 aldehyde dehydrogenase [Solibacillus merdavium]
MELLLENSSGLENERKEALLKLLYSTYFEDRIFLKSSDFYLYFHDLWSLFETGQKYELNIVEDNVRLKDWRIFILEFFASRNLEKMQFEYLTNSSVKKFLISLYIIKKIEKNYITALGKTLKLETIKKEYSSDIDLAITGELLLQQEILLKVQSNWYVNLYKFNTVYDQIIEEILEETHAVEQLFGEKVWDIISNENLKKMMDFLESKHFSEVLFWKSKFQSEQFLKIGLDSKSTYVFCVQKDISMRKSINLQTALALAVAEFSQKNEHNFVYVPFAQSIDQEMIALNGKIDFNDYVGFNNTYDNKLQPVDFKSVINYAFTLLKLGLSHSSGGKVYLLCNELLFENFPQEEEWKEAVTQYKQLKMIEIVVIFIGDKSKLQDIWFADKILVPKQLAQFR